VNDPRLRLTYAVKILENAASLETAIAQGAIEPLDLQVERYRRSRSKMGSNDRRVLALGVYSFARNRETILAAVPELEVGSGAALVLALLDQLSPVASVELPPNLMSFQEPLERLRALRERSLETIEAEEGCSVSEATWEAREAFSVLFSVPGFWLDRGHWQTLGEAAFKMSVSKREQTVQLRVNALKSNRVKALEGLQAEGVEGAATGFSPWGISLPKRVNLNAMKLYREGVVEVQDEGSQLIAQSCLPIEEDTDLLDLCAGACGKTLALAGAVPRSVRLWAYDIDQKRLTRSFDRIMRSGAVNIRFVESAEQLTPQHYDLVIVDAPCSSSGTLRRNPDIAWRWKEGRLQGFSALQLELLEKAAALTRPGGLLVYSTCSIFEDENSNVVDRFLAANSDFSLEPYCEESSLGEVEGAKKGAFWFDSGITGYQGDGFYCARLRKEG
jgi:16S rRNA (cytosine967-C5)-methyltransferase